MLIERGALRQSGDGWSMEPSSRAADAGERARGHRQPDRPARRRRPRGAAGRRGGRHAVLARRGGGRARAPASSRWSARCAGWRSATSSTSSPTPRWPGSPSTGSATCWSATSATSGCRAPSGWPGTSGPPTGSTRCSHGRGHRPGRGAGPPPLGGPRDRPVARHGGRARTPAPRWRRAAPGGPAGATRCTRLDAAASHAGRALEAWPTTADPRRPAPARSCSPPSSPSTATATAFLSGGGAEQVHELADRLLAHGDHACAARAWTLLGQAAWLRADRTAALRLPGPRGASSSTAAGHPAEGARLRRAGPAAHAQLRARDRRVARGQTRRRRSPSGWAWPRPAPTPGSPSAMRPLPGRRPGRPGRPARDRSSSAGASQLPGLRRATQNLAYAVREEGDWLRLGRPALGGAGPHGQRADA